MARDWSQSGVSKTAVSLGSSSMDTNELVSWQHLYFISCCDSNGRIFVSSLAVNVASPIVAMNLLAGRLAATRTAHNPIQPLDQTTTTRFVISNTQAQGQIQLAALYHSTRSPSRCSVTIRSAPTVRPLPLPHSSLVHPLSPLNQQPPCPARPRTSPSSRPLRCKERRGGTEGERDGSV